MKATGIVRKIDDLGRVVIPKEIRKSMHIREGDPLEIFIESKGEIILKKYAPMGDFINISQNCAEVLNESTNFISCITDNENVIAIYGAQKNEYIASQISDEVIEIIEQRKTFSTNNSPAIPIILGENANKYKSQVIVPINSNAEVVGSVILFSLENMKISAVEIKLAESIAKLLSNQIE